MGDSYFRTHRPSAVIYLLSMAGLLVAVGLISVVSFDVWWHLATGRAIALLGEIPRNDIFSYTKFGVPWLNHEWLFELIIWGLYRLGETSALIAFKFLLTASIALLLFRTIIYLTSSMNMGLWGTMLFLWNASQRIMDRPFLLGMCLLAIFCLILHKYIREGSRALWLLPLIQILWINCHGGGFLGVQIAFAFAVGETLQALLGERLGGPGTIGGNRIRRLWLIALACLAASTINPWGAEIFPFYYEHLSATHIMSLTDEWRPILHPALKTAIPPYITLAVLVGTLASYMLGARRARLSHLMATAGTALLLTKGHRFGPEFAIVNIPIMFHNFSSRFAAGRSLPNAACWINIAAAFILSSLALTFGVPISTRGDMLNIPGRGAPASFAPQGAMDFLEKHAIKGRVLNDMGLGAYFIFTRWPRELVFIDGRTPVYGDRFFKEFTEAFKSERNFEEIVERYGIDYIVLAGLAGWDQREFHAFLWQHPQWHLVYAKNDGFVYLRDLPKFKALIEGLALREHPVVEEMRRRGR